MARDAAFVVHHALHDAAATGLDALAKAFVVLLAGGEVLSRGLLFLPLLVHRAGARGRDAALVVHHAFHDAALARLHALAEALEVGLAGRGRVWPFVVGEGCSRARKQCAEDDAFHLSAR